MRYAKSRIGQTGELEPRAARSRPSGRDYDTLISAVRRNLTNVCEPGITYVRITGVRACLQGALCGRWKWLGLWRVRYANRPPRYISADSVVNFEISMLASSRIVVVVVVLHAGNLREGKKRLRFVWKYMRKTANISQLNLPTVVAEIRQTAPA